MAPADTSLVVEAAAGLADGSGAVRQVLLLGLIARGGMAEVYRAQARNGTGERAAARDQGACGRSSRREARFVDMFHPRGQARDAARQPLHRRTFEIGQHRRPPLHRDGVHRRRDLTQVLRRCQETQQRIPVPHAVLHRGARSPRACTSRTRCTDADGRPLNIVNRDVSPSNVRLSLRRRRQAARLRHRAGADEVHQRDRHPQGQVQLHVARSRSAACRSTRAPTCSRPASSSTRC